VWGGCESDKTYGGTSGNRAGRKLGGQGVHRKSDGPGTSAISEYAASVRTTLKTTWGRVGAAGLILGQDLRVEADRPIKAWYLARTAPSPTDLPFRFADNSGSHLGEVAEKSYGQDWRELLPPPPPSPPAFPRGSRILP
jgi:hypothetical protein